MITVNLLKKPKKRGTGLSLKIPFGFGRAGGAAADPQVKNRVTQILVVGGFCAVIHYFWLDYRAAQIAIVDAQIEKAQQDLAAVQKQLAASKQLEELQKQLQGDETMLKAKLETINKLLSDRALSFKVVKSVSTLMPSEIWIRNMSVKEKAVNFGGGAIDYNNVADFIKTLMESGDFTEVKPKFQKQERNDSAGAFVAFELEAKRK